jgi:hypothetical protein
LIRISAEQAREAATWLRSLHLKLLFSSRPGQWPQALARASVARHIARGLVAVAERKRSTGASAQVEVKLDRTAAMWLASLAAGLGFSRDTGSRLPKSTDFVAVQASLSFTRKVDRKASQGPTLRYAVARSGVEGGIGSACASVTVAKASSHC